MEADDPRLVQHMFDIETDGVPSHATIVALTVEHLDRVVAERTAERDALQAEVQHLRAQLSCSCTPHPYGEGPEEDCAVHGRGHDWWVGLANKACEDRAALQARIDAVTALHTKSRRASGFSSPSGVTWWAETCDYCSQRHVGGYETVRWPCNTIRALGVDPQKEGSA